MQYGNDLELGKKDKGPDRRRGRPVEELELELEMKEDQAMIAEFKERLDFNMGRVGPRVSIKTFLGPDAG